MFCLVNAKCSDDNSTSTSVNKLLSTSSNNSTSTSVNKLLSTSSNNSTANTPVSNKIVSTPNCLCNSASRL